MSNRGFAFSPGREAAAHVRFQTVAGRELVEGPHSNGWAQSNQEVPVTIVGILVLIILLLLAIYLFQRVRGGSSRV